jgi:NUMOD3 motif
MKSDYYVYAYFCPYTGIPVYIGAGHGKRWKDHAYGSSRNVHLRQLIIDHGHVPHTKLLTELTEVQAYANEAALIAAIGMAPDGPLFNLQSGGRTGARAHALVRARLSEAARNRCPEYLAKLSEASRGNKNCVGRKLSAETRAKLSEAAKNRSTEYREKIAAAARGYNRTRGENGQFVAEVEKAA